MTVFLFYIVLIYFIPLHPLIVLLIKHFVSSSYICIFAHFTFVGKMKCCGTSLQSLPPVIYLYCDQIINFSYQMIKY